MPPRTPKSRTARAAWRALCALAPAVLLLALAPRWVLAAAPDWGAVADEQEIVALTHDAGGALRETTIWLVVQDGRGYIRTGSTTWGDNAERAGELVLRIRGEEHRLGFELVTDATARERISAAFREKYGFSDLLISPFRGSEPRIMRMLEL